MSQDANYIAGDTVRLSVSLANPDTGTAVDPGTLTLKVRKQDATTQTLTYGSDADIVKDSTGNYHADVLLSSAGNWFWRWDASGVNAGAVESKLAVNSSRVI